MKWLYILLTLWIVLFLSGSAFTQPAEFEQLVQEGIELHDKGEYKEAIKRYEQALRISKNDPYANYELALTYFTMGDYKKAEKVSKIVLKEQNDFYLAGAIINGSALDEMGKPKKAIQVYEKALELYPENHLLNYNAAVTYNRLKKYDLAQERLVSSITMNNLHASSHFLLGEVMFNKNAKVKTMLPLYVGLLIEPTSERSVTNMDLLISTMFQGIQKKGEKRIEVNLFASLSGDKNEFSSIEMMLSLLTAAEIGMDTLNTSDAQKFVSISKQLFHYLSDMKDTSNSFWWNTYGNLLTDIHKNDYSDVFAYYISQSYWEESGTWLETNEAKLDSLFNWLNEE
ncbi:MAG: tetratricopeptide repeat protein [Bacteroidota bacterium]